ncbi:MAG: ribosomal L7Ae/L30e/S12e/Gadd45 family protein [Christensenellales bacterium]|jgi:large subunit ribosomal protein L7A
MPSRLKNADKIVGTRRLVKALEAGQIHIAYLAMDADLFIARQVRGLCEKNNIPLVEVRSMQELGEACSIEVPCASCGIKR